MQDLYVKLEELTDLLMAELEVQDIRLPVRGERGGVPQGAALAILEERQKGTAVTITSDLCSPDAELKRPGDCSEAIYKASQEAINVYKLRIRMVDAQPPRVGVQRET